MNILLGLPPRAVLDDNGLGKMCLSLSASMKNEYCGSNIYSHSLVMNSLNKPPPSIPASTW